MSINNGDQDEAMEWITDWEYERILPPEHQSHALEGAAVVSEDNQDMAGSSDHMNSVQSEEDNDEIMEMMEEDMNPLPLGQGNDQRHSPEHEPAIFWTRVHEDFTDDDLNGMFGLANSCFSATSSRRNSRASLANLADDDEMHNTHTSHHHQDKGHSHSYTTSTKVDSGAVENSSATETGDIVTSYSADDSDTIMSPLLDKEGLLPPMSPSQLYHQSNTQYGIIESPHHQTSHDERSYHQNHYSQRNYYERHPTSPHGYGKEDPIKEYSSRSTGSDGTSTTVDMMEDEGNSSSSSLGQRRRNSDIYERQQQLLQEVLTQAPKRTMVRRSHDLPRPDEQHIMIMKEVQNSVHERPGKPAPAKPDKEDPIFARQQEIFQQLRIAGQRQQQSQQQQQHHMANSPVSSSSYMSRTSPVSVTKTLTTAGMDSAEYQKVVTQLTEKNLLERQRAMLQESMKRSLETRQALHIKPTALPDFDHDKLCQVLKDIESSSRSISETYGRR